MMPLSIIHLPPEILLHIAGYLSNEDVTSFLKVFPFISKLAKQSSFQRWQRRLGDFVTAQNAAFDAIEADRKKREETHTTVSASSLVTKIPEVEEFENNVLPQTLADIQFLNASSQLVLDDVFLCLGRLGSNQRHLWPPLVESHDGAEGSRRLRAALESYAALPSVLALLPLSIAQNLDTSQLPTADRIILAAYLLFTRLRPEDILWLLPRSSKLGYINEQAIAEFLSFLQLFLTLFRLDGTLWQYGMEPIEDEITRRVRWSYTNGSPISEDGLQNLQKRIDRWFLNYHDIQTPVVSDPKAITLTLEQDLFVRTDIAKGEIFKVRAYAGTGKTKCLVDYAVKRPRKRILYVAYNRQAKIDAEMRFRKCYNVDCKTLHSIAYNALAIVNPSVNRRVRGIASDKNHSQRGPSSRRGTFSRIQSAPSDNNFLRDWDVEDIVKALGLTLDSVANVFTTRYDWPDPVSSRGQNAKTVGNAQNPRNPDNLARVISTAINRFCHSSDDEISIFHLSMAQCRSKLCNPRMALPWVKKFWSQIVAGETDMMSHDCYLKMFSLTEDPEADRVTFGKYDIVMFDEAQDANPCMANIIVRQRDAAGIIIIGDPYQMLYGFRGAKNDCFDDTKLPPTRTFHLTKSFRFGQEIADIANLILETIGERKPVRGVNPDTPVPAVFLPPISKSIEAPPGKHTLIFRTNADLVKHFFVTFVKHPEKTMCLKTSATNTASAIIPLVKSGYFLFKGRAPKHPRLRGIKSFEEAKAYLQREEKLDTSETDEVDLPAVALVVGMEKFYAQNENETKFLEMLESSARCIVDIEAAADVVLTTAHQAKGLEWDNVIVANDFITHSLDGLNFGDQSRRRECANLLYVACTRARKRLQISKGLALFVTSRAASFRFFLSNTNLTNSENSACLCCKGKHPTTTFLSERLQARDGMTGTDTSSFVSSNPSPSIGYEALMPPRNPDAPDGWIERTRNPLNPLEIPRSVYVPAMTCANCVIAWRAVSNSVHSDLFRFAEGLKSRVSNFRSICHGDFQVFWAGRFPPNVLPLPPRREQKRQLTDVYSMETRNGWRGNTEMFGIIKESKIAWSDPLAEMARVAGVEYEDDDIDDFIMTYDNLPGV